MALEKSSHEWYCGGCTEAQEQADISLTVLFQTTKEAFYRTAN